MLSIQFFLLKGGGKIYLPTVETPTEITLEISPVDDNRKPIDILQSYFLIIGKRFLPYYTDEKLFKEHKQEIENILLEGGELKVRYE